MGDTKCVPCSIFASLRAAGIEICSYANVLCSGFNSLSVVQKCAEVTVAHGRPWAVWGRTFALMSITHPSGNDLESMSEFYNNFLLRAVTSCGAQKPLVSGAAL